MPDLLIELLSEEIPARMQEFAANELKKNMLSFLLIKAFLKSQQLPIPLQDDLHYL